MQIELEHDLSRADAVLSQYRLTAASYAAVAEELRALCARDGAVAAAWAEACAAYRAWKRSVDR